MVNFQKVEEAGNVARYERRRREENWKRAEEHLGRAREAQSNEEYFRTWPDAHDSNMTEDERASSLRKARQYRFIALAQFRLALECARAPGLDVSDVEIPNE